MHFSFYKFMFFKILPEKLTHEILIQLMQPNNSTAIQEVLFQHLAMTSLFLSNYGFHLLSVVMETYYSG